MQAVVDTPACPLLWGQGACMVWIFNNFEKLLSEEFSITFQ